MQRVYEADLAANANGEPIALLARGAWSSPSSGKKRPGAARRFLLRQTALVSSMARGSAHVLGL